MASVYRMLPVMSARFWGRWRTEDPHAVMTFIYCFIAVRSLLAVQGLQLAACAPLMRIKKKKQTKKAAVAPHSPFAKFLN